MFAGGWAGSSKISAQGHFPAVRDEQPKATAPTLALDGAMRRAPRDATAPGAAEGSARLFCGGSMQTAQPG